jgi:hypothetical protein
VRIISLTMGARIIVLEADAVAWPSADLVGRRFSYGRTKRQGWCPAPKFESFSVNGFDGRGSDLGQPTVDGKVRSSDEAALVAGQEQCRCGDFLWAGESAERNLVGQRRADVVG